MDKMLQQMMSANEEEKRETSTRVSDLEAELKELTARVEALEDTVHAKFHKLENKLMEMFEREQEESTRHKRASRGPEQAGGGLAAAEEGPATKGRAATSTSFLFHLARQALG